MGAPMPPPKKRSPLVFVLAGLAVVVVLGVVAVGVMVFQSAGNRVSGPLQAEQCIDTGFGEGASNRIPASTRVNCDDPAAKAKVLKVTSDRQAAALRFQTRAEPDCPAGTDGVTNVTLKKGDEHYFEACARNIEGPHPGDPGAGGALLSVGDCVSGGGLGLGGKEVACSTNDWYGKVIARVDTEASCPAKTLETMKLRAFSGNTIERPVLCLGAGGGVVAAGDCIADPSFAVGGLKKADCTSQTAVAQVTGRVKTKRECPATSTHHMTADGAYLPIMCLKQMRPTLNDKIRNLGR
ncbi:hypothetical protein E1200_06340 [Actinomadura sp. GC306]|uniref:LppU/SCO3897 family protein n=1 Tax=Actinomadura sp. GC306 TaxID=2530367 RepID=UPI00104CAA4F|nr:hypothetical protein [Actinomadura sp. GC306]TDC70096.1 hypothetical protein E1200_06340 [Actinomadura sp. GC306]